VTTQTPRWDVEPGDAVIEESASPADQQSADGLPVDRRIKWLLVAAIVGGVMVLVGILYVAG
jgi:hypothetical protein